MHVCFGKGYFAKVQGQNQPTHWDIIEEKVQKPKMKCLQQNKDRKEKRELQSEKQTEKVKKIERKEKKSPHK